MGMNVNFVARQLVGASPGMFGFRGGKAIVRFRPGVLIRASFRAGGQLLFIVLEIVINPLQLAAQAVFLAGAHPGAIILMHDASSHLKTVRDAALKMESEGLLSVVLLPTPRGLVIAQPRANRT